MNKLPQPPFLSCEDRRKWEATIMTTPGRMMILQLVAILALANSPAPAADIPGPAHRLESFDRDPKWEGHNNRVVPKEPKTVRQNFGHSDTNVAGNAKGEIGGTIWRSSAPATYADAIAPKTLHDRLSASGSFALTASSGSSGAFFGWFNAHPSDGGRQNSLGIRFAGEGSGARLTLQLVTAKNQACGTKVTPWIVDKTKPIGAGRKVRPTSIRNDGTRYTWKLDYDPAGNNGNGQMQFAIRDNRAEQETFEDKAFTVDLLAGYKDHGTTFDRFGFATSARPGNAMTIYFDDLDYNGKTQAFAADPGWIGAGNHDS
jgi:hypothetical protein